ncbi:MAG TPA: response regulator [Candidatus Omnitrophota bacterium]|nr:response regulator [Candidatus Omnitrophota bacterium]
MAVVFLTTTILWDPSAVLAAVGGMALREQEQFRKDLQSYLYTLPSEIGTLHEIVDGGGRRADGASSVSPTSNLQPPFEFVIHIQDAHANPEAQRNIYRTLKFLAEKYPGLSVAIEGAEGPLYPEYLDLFREFPAANQAVIEDLLQKGELTGAELFVWDNYRATRNAQGATGKTNALSVERGALIAPKVQGVENTELYASNLRAYRDLLFKRGDIQKLLIPIRERLEKESSRALNPGLRGFLKERDRRKEGRYDVSGTVSDANLQAYVRTLRKEISKTLAIDLNDAIEQLRFPNLVRVVLLEKNGQGFDRARAADEWKKLIEEIRPAAKTVAEKQLVEALSVYGAEKVGLEKNSATENSSAKVGRGMLGAPEALYPRKLLERLSVFARGHKIDLADRKAFLESLKFLIFQSEIDVTGLMSEMDSLESQLIAKLSRTDAEKEFVRQLENSGLLVKLLSLELSRAEYRKALEVRGDLAVLVKGNKNLLAALEKAFSFYEGTLKRDGALAENTLALSKQDGGRRMADGASGFSSPFMLHPSSRLVVLITGGFHSEGVREALVEQGAGYASLTPRISKTDHGEMYQRVMADDNADLSAYFKVKNPFLTKQEALLFKETLEIAAPVLSGTYQITGADKARRVQNAFADSPVLSRATAAENLQDPAELRFSPRSAGAMLPQNAAIPSVPVTAGQEFAAHVARAGSVVVSTVPADVSFTGPSVVTVSGARQLSGTFPGSSTATTPVDFRAEKRESPQTSSVAEGVEFSELLAGKVLSEGTKNRWRSLLASDPVFQEFIRRYRGSLEILVRSGRGEQAFARELLEKFPKTDWGASVAEGIELSALLAGEAFSPEAKDRWRALLGSDPAFKQFILKYRDRLELFAGSQSRGDREFAREVLGRVSRAELRAIEETNAKLEASDRAERRGVSYEAVFGVMNAGFLDRVRSGKTVSSDEHILMDLRSKALRELGAAFDEDSADEAVRRIREEVIPSFLVAADAGQRELLRDLLLKQARQYHELVRGFGTVAFDKDRDTRQTLGAKEDVHEDVLYASFQAMDMLTVLGDEKALTELINLSREGLQAHSQSRGLQKLIDGVDKLEKEQRQDDAWKALVEQSSVYEAVRRWTVQQCMLLQSVSRIARQLPQSGARDAAVRLLADILLDHDATAEGYYWLRQQAAYRLRDFDSDVAVQALDREASNKTRPPATTIFITPNLDAANDDTMSVQLQAGMSRMHIHRTRAFVSLRDHSDDFLSSPEFESSQNRFARLVGIQDALIDPVISEAIRIKTLERIGKAQGDAFALAGNILLDALEEMMAQKPGEIFSSKGRQGLLTPGVKKAALKAFMRIAGAVGSRLENNSKLYAGFRSAIGRAAANGSGIAEALHLTHVALANLDRIAQLASFEEGATRLDLSRNIIIESGGGAAVAMAGVVHRMTTDPALAVISGTDNGGGTLLVRGRNAAQFGVPTTAMGDTTRFACEAAVMESAPAALIIRALMSYRCSKGAKSFVDELGQIKDDLFKKARQANGEEAFKKVFDRVLEIAKRVDATGQAVEFNSVRNLVHDGLQLMTEGQGEESMNLDAVYAGFGLFRDLVGSKGFAVVDTPYGNEMVVTTNDGQEKIGQDFFSHTPSGTRFGRERRISRMKDVSNYYPDIPLHSRVSPTIKNADLILSGLSSWGTSLGILFKNPGIVSAMEANHKATKILLANPVRDDETRGMIWREAVDDFIHHMAGVPVESLWNRILTTANTDLDLPIDTAMPQMGTKRDAHDGKMGGYTGANTPTNADIEALQKRGIQVNVSRNWTEVKMTPRRTNPDLFNASILAVSEELAQALWEIMKTTTQKKLTPLPIFTLIERHEELSEKLQQAGLTLEMLGLSDVHKLIFHPGLVKEFTAWLNEGTVPAWIAEKGPEEGWVEYTLRRAIEETTGTRMDPGAIRLDRPLTILQKGGRTVMVEFLSKERTDQVFHASRVPIASDLNKRREEATHRLGKVDFTDYVTKKTVTILFPNELLTVGRNPKDRLDRLKAVLQFQIEKMDWILQDKDAVRLSESNPEAFVGGLAAAGFRIAESLTDEIRILNLEQAIAPTGVGEAQDIFRGHLLSVVEQGLGQAVAVRKEAAYREHLEFLLHLESLAEKDKAADGKDETVAGRNAFLKLIGELSVAIPYQRFLRIAQAQGKVPVTMTDMDGTMSAAGTELTTPMAHAHHDAATSETSAIHYITGQDFRGPKKQIIEPMKQIERILSWLSIRTGVALSREGMHQIFQNMSFGACAGSALFIYKKGVGYIKVNQRSIPKKQVDLIVLASRLSMPKVPYEIEGYQIELREPQMVQRPDGSWKALGFASVAILPSGRFDSKRNWDLPPEAKLRKKQAAIMEALLSDPGEMLRIVKQLLGKGKNADWEFTVRGKDGAERRIKVLPEQKEAVLELFKKNKDKWENPGQIAPIIISAQAGGSTTTDVSGRSKAEGVDFALSDPDFNEIPAIQGRDVTVAAIGDEMQQFESEDPDRPGEKIQSRGNDFAMAEDPVAEIGLLVHTGSWGGTLPNTATAYDPRGIEPFITVDLVTYSGRAVARGENVKRVLEMEKEEPDRFGDISKYLVTSLEDLNESQASELLIARGAGRLEIRAKTGVSSLEASDRAERRTAEDLARAVIDLKMTDPADVEVLRYIQGRLLEKAEKGLKGISGLLSPQQSFNASAGIVADMIGAGTEASDRPLFERMAAFILRPTLDGKFSPRDDRLFEAVRTLFSFTEGVAPSKLRFSGAVRAIGDLLQPGVSLTGGKLRVHENIRQQQAEHFLRLVKTLEGRNERADPSIEQMVINYLLYTGMSRLFREHLVLHTREYSGAAVQKAFLILDAVDKATGRRGELRADAARGFELRYDKASGNYILVKNKREIERISFYRGPIAVAGDLVRALQSEGISVVRDPGDVSRIIFGAGPEAVGESVSVSNFQKLQEWVACSPALAAGAAAAKEPQHPINFFRDGLFVQHIFPEEAAKSGRGVRAERRDAVVEPGPAAEVEGQEEIVMKAKALPISSVSGTVLFMPRTKLSLYWYVDAENLPAALATTLRFTEEMSEDLGVMFPKSTGAYRPFVDLEYYKQKASTLLKEVLELPLPDQGQTGKGLQKVRELFKYRHFLPFVRIGVSEREVLIAKFEKLVAEEADRRDSEIVNSLIQLQGLSYEHWLELKLVLATVQREALQGQALLENMPTLNTATADQWGSPEMVRELGILLSNLGKSHPARSHPALVRFLEDYHDADIASSGAEEGRDLEELIVALKKNGKPEATLLHPLAAISNFLVDEEPQPEPGELGMWRNGFFMDHVRDRIALLSHRARVQQQKEQGENGDELLEKEWALALRAIQGIERQFMAEAQSLESRLRGYHEREKKVAEYKARRANPVGLNAEDLRSLDRKIKDGEQFLEEFKDLSSSLARSQSNMVNLKSNFLNDLNDPEFKIRAFAAVKVSGESLIEYLYREKSGDMRMVTGLALRTLLEELPEASRVMKRGMADLVSNYHVGLRRILETFDDEEKPAAEKSQGSERVWGDGKGPVVVLIRGFVVDSQVENIRKILGKRLVGIFATQGDKGTHWVQLLLSRSNRPGLAFLSEGKYKDLLDNIREGDTVALKLQEGSEEAEVIHHPSAKTLAEIHAAQREEALLRGGEKILEAARTRVPVRVTLDTQNPDALKAEGSAGAGLVRGDVMNHAMRRRYSAVLEAIGRNKFDFEGWFRLWGTVDFRGMKSGADLDHFQQDLTRVLDVDALMEVQGFLAELVAEDLALLRNARGRVPFRTIDLVNDDSKGQEMVNLILEMQRRYPHSNLVRDLNKGFFSFHFYENSQAGLFVLIKQLTAEFIAAHQLAEEGGSPQLAPLFPMVESAAQIDFIQREVLPVATRLAVWNIASQKMKEQNLSNGERFELLRKIEESMREQVLGKTRFGVMVETRSLLRDPEERKKIIAHPLVSFFNFGTNDLTQQAASDAIGHNVRRDDPESSYFFSPMYGELVNEEDALLTDLAAYNRDRPESQNKDADICGQKASDDNFLNPVTQWDRQGIPISVSVPPADIPHVKHVLLRLQQVPAERLDQTTKLPLSARDIELLDLRVSELNASLLGESRKFLKTAYEWHDRYREAGFYRNFYRSDLNPVEGLGSVREFYYLRKLIRSRMSDSRKDDPAEPVTSKTVAAMVRVLSKNGFLLPYEQEGLIRGFVFLDAVRRAYGRLGLTGSIDPSRLEELIAVFSEEEPAPWLPPLPPDATAEDRAKRANAFYKQYFSHANLVFNTMIRYVHEGFMELFPPASENVQVIGTLKSANGREILLRRADRSGVMFERDEGFVYKTAAELYVEPQDMAALDQLLKEDPSAVIELFKMVVGPRGRLRIGYGIQRAIVKAVATMPERQDLSPEMRSKLDRALKEFFTMPEDISYAFWRMHRFGFLRKCCPGYDAMRADFLTGENRFSVHMETFQAIEFMEGLPRRGEFALAHAREVSLKIRKDQGEHASGILRLAVFLDGIMRSVYKTAPMSRDEVAAFVNKELESRGWSGEDRAKISWLIYEKRILADLDPMSDQEVAETLAKVLSGWNQKSGMIDLLYMMLLATRIGSMRPSKILLALRQGPESGLAGWEEFHRVGTAVLDSGTQKSPLIDLYRRAGEVRQFMLAEGAVGELAGELAASIRDPKVFQRLFDEANVVNVPLSAAEKGQILAFLSDPDFFKVLFQKYVERFGWRYIRALDLEEHTRDRKTILKQLLFLAALEFLAGKGKSDALTIAEFPLPLSENRAPYEILIGVPVADSEVLSAVHLTSRALYQHGFVIEDMSASVLGTGSGVVLRFLGVFPAKITDSASELQKVRTDLQKIFERQKWSVVRFLSGSDEKRIVGRRYHAMDNLFRGPLRVWRRGAVGGAASRVKLTPHRFRNNVLVLNATTVDYPGLIAFVSGMLARNYKLNGRDFSMTDLSGGVTRIMAYIERETTSEEPGFQQRIEKEMKERLEYPAAEMDGSKIKNLSEADRAEKRGEKKEAVVRGTTKAGASERKKASAEKIQKPTVDMNWKKIKTDQERTLKNSGVKFYPDVRDGSGAGFEVEMGSARWQYWLETGKDPVSEKSFVRVINWFVSHGRRRVFPEQSSSDRSLSFRPLESAEGPVRAIVSVGINEKEGISVTIADVSPAGFTSPVVRWADKPGTSSEEMLFETSKGSPTSSKGSEGSSGLPQQLGAPDAFLPAHAASPSSAEPSSGELLAKDDSSLGMAVRVPKDRPFLVDVGHRIVTLNPAFDKTRYRFLSVPATRSEDGTVMTVYDRLVWAMTQVLENWAKLPEEVKSGEEKLVSRPSEAGVMTQAKGVKMTEDPELFVARKTAELGKLWKILGDSGPDFAWVLDEDALKDFMAEAAYRNHRGVREFIKKYFEMVLFYAEAGPELRGEMMAGLRDNLPEKFRGRVFSYTAFVKAALLKNRPFSKTVFLRERPPSIVAWKGTKDASWQNSMAFENSVYRFEQGEDWYIAAFAEWAGRTFLFYKTTRLRDWQHADFVRELGSRYEPMADVPGGMTLLSPQLSAKIEALVAGTPGVVKTVDKSVFGNVAREKGLVGFTDNSVLEKVLGSKKLEALKHELENLSLADRPYFVMVWKRPLLGAWIEKRFGRWLDKWLGNSLLIWYKKSASAQIRQTVERMVAMLKERDRVSKERGVSAVASGPDLGQTAPKDRAEKRVGAVTRPLEMSAAEAARVRKIFILGHQGQGNTQLSYDVKHFSVLVPLLLTRFPNAQVDMAVDYANLFAARRFADRVSIVRDPAYSERTEPQEPVRVIYVPTGAIADAVDRGNSAALVDWLAAGGYDYVLDFAQCGVGLEESLFELSQRPAPADGSARPKLPVAFLNMSPLPGTNPSMTDVPDPVFRVDVNLSEGEHLSRVRGTEDLNRTTPLGREARYWEMIFRVYREMGLLRERMDLQLLDLGNWGLDDLEKDWVKPSLEGMLRRSGLSESEARDVLASGRKFIYVNVFSHSYPELGSPEIWEPLLSWVLRNTDSVLFFSLGGRKDEGDIRQLRGLTQKLAAENPEAAKRIVLAPENLSVTRVIQLMRVMDLAMTPERSGFSDIATVLNVPQFVVAKANDSPYLTYRTNSVIAEQGGLQKTGEIAQSLSARKDPVRLQILENRTNKMPKHILLVDDERTLRYVTAMFLRAKYRGTKVTEAGDGEEALAILRGDPTIDFLLTDLKMPRVDGIALSRQASDLRPGMPILVMSAYLGTEDSWAREQISAFQVSGIPIASILKPFKGEEFESAIIDVRAVSENQKLKAQIPVTPEEGLRKEGRAELRLQDLDGSTPVAKRILGRTFRPGILGVVDRWVPQEFFPQIFSARVVTDGMMHAPGVAYYMAGGVNEANVGKANLWIAGQLISEELAVAPGISDARLEKLLTVLKSALPAGIQLLSLGEREGPEVHVNLSNLTGTDWTALLSEKNWVPLVPDFGVMLGALAAVHGKLLLNVTADERTAQVIEQKLRGVAAKSGISLGRKELRLIATGRQDPFASLSGVTKADALVAQNRGILEQVAYRKGLGSRWVTDDAGDMKSLVAGITTILYAAMDERVDRFGIHRPSEYNHGAMLNAVLDAIKGYAQLLIAA